MFGEDMSIFALSTCSPFSNSPFFIRSNNPRFSEMGRSRYGLLVPGAFSVPLEFLISSLVWLST